MAVRVGYLSVFAMHTADPITGAGAPLVGLCTLVASTIPIQGFMATGAFEGGWSLGYFLAGRTAEEGLLTAMSAHLLIIGPDNDGYWPRIAQQIDRLGLQPYVTRIEMLRGRLKWEALAASRLFVLPSHQENFAIAVAEALRIGTPVVISDRVNIWPTVAAGGAGRVVHRDLDSVVDAIRTSLEDGGMWRAMSEAAVSVACSHFDWCRSADAMMRVYEHVLEHTPARAARSGAGGCVATSSVAGVHP